MDIYLLKPESSLISCNVLPGISDHDGVLMEVEWDEICWETKVERIIPVYHKTNVLGLHVFLWEEFNLRAGNGSRVEEIWKSYKNIIFEGIKRYVPQKILSKNPDPEYYNKEVKRLKVKARKIWAALPGGSETIIQGITGSKEEDSGNIFTFRLTKRRQMLDRVL